MVEENTDSDESTSKSSKDLDGLFPQAAPKKDRSKIRSELLQRRKKKPVALKKNPEKATNLDTLFDNTLGESIEDFLSDIENVVVKTSGDKPEISGPIIDILRSQGYIAKNLSSESELKQVPEYEILKIIIKEHPIALSKIEEMSEIETLSLVLSNLQADELIVQTNDYKWTISAKVQENLIEIVSQNKSKIQTLDRIAEMRREIDTSSTYERQYITAMYKLGLISSFDLSLDEMMKIPDFAVIRAIKNQGPIGVEKIQDLIPAIPPVQITRLLSKLEGEQRLSKTTEGLWQLTEKFVEFIVKDYV